MENILFQIITPKKTGLTYRGDFIIDTEVALNVSHEVVESIVKHVEENDVFFGTIFDLPDFENVKLVYCKTKKRPILCFESNDTYNASHEALSFAKSKKKPSFLWRLLKIVFLLLLLLGGYIYAMYAGHCPVPKVVSDYTIGWLYALDPGEAETAKKVWDARYVLLNSKAGDEAKKLENLAINSADNDAIVDQFHVVMSKLDSATIDEAAGVLGITHAEVEDLREHPTNAKVNAIRDKIGFDLKFFAKFRNENLDDIEFYN